MGVVENMFDTLFAYLRYAHQRSGEVGHLERGRELSGRSSAVVRLKVEKDLSLVRYTLSTAYNEARCLPSRRRCSRL